MLEPAYDIIKCTFFREMASLSCRFYSNEFPDIEDPVMVKVQKIAEMGAYVTLCEYDNKGNGFHC